MSDWSGKYGGQGGQGYGGREAPEFGTPGWGRRAVMITGIAYGGALLVSVVLLLMGRGVIGSLASESLVLAGLIGLLLVLTSAPMAMIVAVWAATSPVHQLTRRIEDLQDAVKLISEQAALSDDARRVLNRANERAMLCRAIEQDIAAREWEAALVLCNELAGRFGYRADAEEFRARIDRERWGDVDAAAREGLALIDGMLLQRRWGDAQQEAERLAREHPQIERMVGLPARVATAREDYKAELKQRFTEAAADRPEDALVLLKELDIVLSEQEAAPLRETARTVVIRARESMGAQFKAALEDEDWADAAAIGRRIITEFPNTKMASEVRDMLDGILARANTF